jgi:hypothetical protein
MEYLGACLAYLNCKRLTGSDAKQQLAKTRMDNAHTEATASNALMNPPQSNADDTWVAARMQ